PIADVSSVAEYLDEWTHCTVPPLPAHLHLLGKERTSSAEVVREWANAAPAPLIVRAETLSLARQFVAAVLASFPEDAGIQARSLVVRSEAAYRWALRQSASGPLIIVPTFDAPRAPGYQHRVVHGLGPAGPGSPHITVGPVPYRLLGP